MSDERGEGLVWFLLGGLLGVGAALLLAPASGDDTRRRLLDWADQAKERGGRLVKEGRERASHEKDRFGAAFRAGRKAFEEGGESKES
jgi:gas vesicle protein